MINYTNNDMRSYLESTARERVERLFDAGSFVEFLPPSSRVISPHLGQLDAPVAFDALARGRFEVAAHVVVRVIDHVGAPSIVSTAWSRRRLTTAGVAPMSLMAMLASINCQRS